MGPRLPEPPPPPRGGGPERESLLRRLWARFLSWPLWAQVAVAIVALLIGVGVFANPEDQGTPAAVQQTTQSPPPEPSPSPQPSPSPSEEPPTVDVPSLLGQTEKSAITTLEGLGLKVLTTLEYSKGREGVVIDQSPEGGSLEEGSVVRLTIAQALPTIPDVVGLRLARARHALKGLGYRLEVRKQASSQPVGTVLSQRPAADASAKPGRLVTLLVAKAPPPTGGGGGNCDPSYPGVCIPPPPPDLDCGDISYTNFRVTGSDPHGFDGDDDGIGCET